MTVSEPVFERKRGTKRSPLRRAFSLTEILVVTSIMALLLALTAPGFVALAPSRKMAIHELSGFLENARARSIATRSEMIVAFADENFPGEEGPYRSYALFTLDGNASNADAERPLRQLSPWRTLPKGLVFARKDDFEVEKGVDFRTILDAPARRLFPVPRMNAAAEPSGGMVLPYLLFGPDGGVLVPGFSDADALHVGIAEGYYNAATGRVELAGTRPGRNGAGQFANGECLEVGFYSGRSRILTD